MMKPERTVSTEKEDKQDFISAILLESLNNPLENKALQNSFEEFVNTSVRPIIINKEDFEDGK